MSQPDWACDSATKNPEKHFIDTQGTPEDSDDFASKAALYCNRYKDCYGRTGECINAVTPDRLKKHKKKSHKKHRGGKRRRRRKSTKKKKRRRRRKSTKKKKRRRRRKSRK